jgi:hypothetical protein
VIKQNHNKIYDIFENALNGMNDDVVVNRHDAAARGILSVLCYPIPGDTGVMPDISDFLLTGLTLHLEMEASIQIDGRSGHSRIDTTRLHQKM